MIRKLCKDLKKQPWDNTLRLHILTERKQLSKLIRKNHRIYKKRIYDKLLNTNENNTSEFWNIVDSLKEKGNDKNPQNITHAEWMKHFEQLMNKKQTNNYIKDQSSVYSATYDTDVLNANISSKEKFEALKLMKKKKSSGPDKILSEIITISCKLNVDIYLELFNSILKSGIYPNLWKENFITPILKEDATIIPLTLGE